MAKSSKAQRRLEKRRKNTAKRKAEKAEKAEKSEKSETTITRPKVYVHDYGTVLLFVGPKNSLMVADPVCGLDRLAAAFSQARIEGKSLLGLVSPDEFLASTWDL